MWEVDGFGSTRWISFLSDIFVEIKLPSSCCYKVVSSSVVIKIKQDRFRVWQTKNYSVISYGYHYYFYKL